MTAITQEFINSIRREFFFRDNIFMRNYRGKEVVVGWFDKSSGYWKLKYKQKSWLLHRFIFLWDKGYLPEMVDHQDRDVNHNLPNNLRDATRSQNTINSEARSDNTSGYKGVTWHKNVGKWHSSVFKEGKRHYCGVYDCKNEAAQAYNTKATELFGEFAVLNEIKEDYIGA